MPVMVAALLRRPVVEALLDIMDTSGWETERSDCPIPIDRFRPSLRRMLGPNQASGAALVTTLVQLACQHQKDERRWMSSYGLKSLLQVLVATGDCVAVREFMTNERWPLTASGGFLYSLTRLMASLFATVVVNNDLPMAKTLLDVLQFVAPAVDPACRSHKSVQNEATDYRGRSGLPGVALVRQTFGRNGEGVVAQLSTVTRLPVACRCFGAVSQRKSSAVIRTDSNRGGDCERAPAGKCI